MLLPIDITVSYLTGLEGLIISRMIEVWAAAKLDKNLLFISFKYCKVERF